MNLYYKNTVIGIVIGYFAATLFSCGKNSSGTLPVVTPPVAATGDIECWLTTGDKSVLLSKQTDRLSFGIGVSANSFVDVDSTQSYQSIDGFGFTLTGGSATVINRLSISDRTNLLTELFGSSDNSIGISYLRISIGASDLSDTIFSYDDLPKGQADLLLNDFNLGHDTTALIPLLKEILLINPSLKVMATPWSAPPWMKDNENSIGGGLQTRYYKVYANYLVKYIQLMRGQGITIDAITPQNEPLNGSNNPSMLMAATEERDFIKNNLGPAFRSAALTTKIIAYDHNCDHPDYPLTVLEDAAAGSYTDGSAFHLYAGSIGILSQVHNTYPDKNIYFTEQWTMAAGNFQGDLDWHLKNVIIGSMRNWSRVALEWNLANDNSYGPHTPGGCYQCQGALTFGSTLTRNVSYYIIAHASKFVPPGSVRISSTIPGSLQNVAFLTPNGKKVLIVENDGTKNEVFDIRFKSKWVTATLPAGAVATYIWN